MQLFAGDQPNAAALRKLHGFLGERARRHDDARGDALHRHRTVELSHDADAHAIRPPLLELDEDLLAGALENEIDAAVRAIAAEPSTVIDVPVTRSSFSICVLTLPVMTVSSTYWPVDSWPRLTAQPEVASTATEMAAASSSFRMIICFLRRCSMSKCRSHAAAGRCGNVPSLERPRVRASAGLRGCRFILDDIEATRGAVCTPPHGHRAPALAIVWSAFRSP